ncbi:hypothetical protein FNV62_06580 [Streptomyces sp. RLB3-17]|uniref:hypothetical protein n=1 Tax=Streptomyces sp. RLB3-17 TaxID=2594455 RepID=UPI0011638361|nr:hypothetical protein [Streptomyces sp. RLB3-17]QDO37884.1 hypothetical protein FNV62_06580 [Streptomyces sp. RLB3-17]
MSEESKPSTGGAPGGRPTASARGRRRAFLGTYAPAFYDWANRHDVYGSNEPNAVLENAIGLMLCYDELWFLDRRHCPMDMQDLNFVKFVSDDAELARTAGEVAGDVSSMLWKQLARPRGHPERPAYSRRRISTHPQYANRWSQHHPLQDHLSGAMQAAGNSCDLRPLKGATIPWMGPWADVQQMSEWVVADALQLGPMDYIVNSGSAVLLDLWQTTEHDESGEPDAMQFEQHKVAAVEELLHLRSTEALTSQGPFHEYVLDLRKDRRIHELRDVLAGAPSSQGSAAALVAEVEQQVADVTLEALSPDPPA